MRRICRVLIIATICVLLSGALLGCGSGQGTALALLPAPPLSQVKGYVAQAPIHVQTTLPKAPQTLMVYRISYPEVNDEYVSRLRRALALEGQAEAGADSIMVRDGAVALEVYRATGAFWYKDTTRLWSGKRPAALPDAAAGASLATALLARVGLLPENMIFAGTGHSNVTIYDTATGQQTSYDTDLHVNFRLMVQEMPVEGPGAKIKAYLGDNGELIGLYWATFGIQPYRPYPIISAERAVESLQESGVISTLKQVRRVNLTEVSLVYYAGPGLERQEYLEPVYRMAGTVEGEEGVAEYVQYVPAIEGRYLKPSPAPDAESPAREP